MEYVPFFVSLLFVLTTALAGLFWYKATHGSTRFLWGMLGWLAAVALFALAGFFTVTHTLPPRFILMVAPPLVAIIALFVTPMGKRFLDGLPLRTLTLLHVVRIPVELILALLAMYKAVPQLMTFEGRNFDLISGLSAPLVYYFGFVRKKWSTRVLLLWNVLCLLLLLNIVVHGVLAAPSPFQQFAFDQPNKALMYFPFVWLPSFIVPTVLLAHIAAIRKLLLPSEIKTEGSAWAASKSA
jgi:hypothetical protein